MWDYELGEEVNCPKCGEMECSGLCAVKPEIAETPKSEEKKKKSIDPFAEGRRLGGKRAAETNKAKPGYFKELARKRWSK